MSYTIETNQADVCIYIHLLSSPQLLVYKPAIASDHVIHVHYSIENLTGIRVQALLILIRKGLWASINMQSFLNDLLNIGTLI